LVILGSALGPLRSKADRDEFLGLLEATPASTALVIVESAELKPDHWLFQWAGAHPETVYKKAMALPRGGALVRWVVDYTRREGGEMTVQAAQHLVTLIGDDNRLAAAEADKLMAYVGYARPVDVDDVDLLTAPVRQADVFKMVDALGARNGRLAITMLQDLLATRDAISIFGMIVRQVRLLLLYKEAQAEKMAPGAIAKELAVRDFLVPKLAAQAANFDVPALEALYVRLDDLDHRIKTGEIEVEIALNTVVAEATTNVAEVTTPARSPR
jgi:DNA polymerase-3 subunit delta